MPIRHVTSPLDAAAEAPARIRPGYPSDDKRRKAALRFGSGLGCITTASVLDLNPDNVRERVKLYRSGKFKPEPPRHLYRFNEIHKANGVSPSTIRRRLKAADETAAEGAVNARSGEGMKTKGLSELMKRRSTAFPTPST